MDLDYDDEYGYDIPEELEEFFVKVYNKAQKKIQKKAEELGVDPEQMFGAFFQHVTEN
jgi:hypothetical protein